MVRHSDSRPSDAREAASEIFVAGFPLLLLDAVRGAHPMTSRCFSPFAYRAGELIPGLFLDDADCIHTSAIVDLATGPAVLHIPYSYGRYVSVTLIDATGEPFASIGTQTMEHSNADVMLVGPTWSGEVSRDVRALRAPSDVVWAVSRIVAHSVADRPKVRALAAQQRLSAPHDHDVAAATAHLSPPPALDLLDLSILRDLSLLDPPVVFHRLRQLIERAPAPVRDRLQEAIGDRLAKLRSADASEAALRAGFADGWRSIQEARRRLQTVRSWAPPGMPTTHEPGAHVRAALTLTRLGSPLPQDIHTLDCAEDESGRPLNSGEAYRIRFPPTALPPVSAGWRLSAHSAAERSSGAVVGDHSPMTLAPDGALEIRIQRDSPVGEGVNWLRAPEGAFLLTLRLYAPTAEALDGRWRVAPVERLGSRNGIPRPRLGRATLRRDSGPRPGFGTLMTAWRPAT